MKKTEIALASAFVLCIAALMLQIPFARSCEAVRGDTLRLHIVANSDSEADQDVKLQVRDALLRASGALFADCGGRDEAAAAAQSHAGEIAALAEQVLHESGFAYGARVRVTDMYFEQRVYDGLTLPAGEYRALRIELGAAEGKNWWCVVYPSLCVPSATGGKPGEALEDYTEEERGVVLQGERYVVKFKIEEWLQSLRRAA